MISNQVRFQETLSKFDQANSQDPNAVSFRGKEYPKELLYAQQMTAWLIKVKPNASETLQLATRSQHICRWTSPRDNYSMDRVGYLKWRTELKNFHAEKAGEILMECGYDDETIIQVKSLIRKEKMKTDPESQLLEDVVCLVFLENYFEEFSEKHDEEKVISIIRKTWKKMSKDAQQTALTLDLNQDARSLVELALND